MNVKQQITYEKAIETKAGMSAPTHAAARLPGWFRFSSPAPPSPLPSRAAADGATPTSC